MSKSNYRDLVVWQKARKLAASVYRFTRRFPDDERFGLTQQMRRAAVSVPCNIAEGHGRITAKDILKFLTIARGSLYELETQALIACDLEYVTEDAAEAIVRAVLDVARLANGLIRHYERAVQR